MQTIEEYKKSDRIKKEERERETDGRATTAAVEVFLRLWFVRPSVRPSICLSALRFIWRSTESLLFVDVGCQKVFSIFGFLTANEKKMVTE